VEPARSGLGTRGLAARALLLLGSACAPEWKNADLQLDVTDFPFSDEDRIAICVEGAGMLESAAADGLIAFPGIPDAFPRIVTVAGENGLGGSADFDSPGYRTVRARELTIDVCPGERADQGTGLLLGVRLLP
jgi:hypothetical protein